MQLQDEKTGNPIQKYTTKQVVEEEDRIIRHVESLYSSKAYEIKNKAQEKAASTLNMEQQKAFNEVLSGRRISFIQGAAGTGKSYLLKALHDGYDLSKMKVRGLAPTNEAARDLEKAGFKNSSTLHFFLYQMNKSKQINPTKEIWIIDEASMIENRVLQEILRMAKKGKNQVILVGDEKQLPPVGRGGMFKFLCDKYGSSQLSEIQRQEKMWSRDVSKDLFLGNVSSAIEKLHNNNAIIWHDTKEDAILALVKRWFLDKDQNSNEKSFILEHTNKYAKVINDLIHEMRKQKKEIGQEELECETYHGRSKISQGDRIQFRDNNAKIGVNNGVLGEVLSVSKSKIEVQLDVDNKKVSFDPQKYCHFHLGYAGTYHKSQGKTVDRAYVMHSTGINRNLFYVGLSRHKKDVSYFVSKDEVSCL